MYYNPCCGMPVSPCMPQPCPIYQHPVMPIQPYGVQQPMPTPQPMNYPVQQPMPAPQPMNYPMQQPVPAPQPMNGVMPAANQPMNYAQPVPHYDEYSCYPQAPAPQPISLNVDATIQPMKPQVKPADCGCHAKEEPCVTQTTYKKTTYMEAEVPLIQSIRAPYQTVRPATPMCENLPIAQAYVQPQVYGNLSSLDDTLEKGTFFNDLYKPYKPGGRK